MLTLWDCFCLVAHVHRLSSGQGDEPNTPCLLIARLLLLAGGSLTATGTYSYTGGCVQPRPLSRQDGQIAALQHLCGLFVAFHDRAVRLSKLSFLKSDKRAVAVRRRDHQRHPILAPGTQRKSHLHSHIMLCPIHCLGTMCAPSPSKVCDVCVVDVGKEGNGQGLLCVVQEHRVQRCNSKHDTVGQPEGRGGEGRGGEGVSRLERECAGYSSREKWLLSIWQTCRHGMK